MNSIRVGVAGWDYRDWKGVVYPARRPRGFDPVLRAGKLGAVLVQFPWSFKNDESSREWLGDLVRAFRKYPLVVEVRHESWNEPEFYAWLGEEGVGFVNVDQPLFGKSIRPSARSTSRVGYVRVHGRNYRDWFRKAAGRDERYDYLYEPAELRPWVARAREIARDRTTEVVNVVFNNHVRGQGVVNALQFKKMVGGRQVAAPPMLFEAFAGELAGYAKPVAPVTGVGEEAGAVEERAGKAGERRRAA